MKCRNQKNLSAWSKAFDFILEILCGAVMSVIQFLCGVSGHKPYIADVRKTCLYCLKELK